jgi:Zn-dependent M16 (insulinase) family peptidase
VITNILKSLKGNGPYSVDEKTLHNFLKVSAVRAATLIKNKKIDTIIFPKSSSHFTQAFVEEIGRALGSYPVNIIADALIKKQIKDIDVQKGDMTELINFEHPAFHTLKDATIKSLEKQIAKNIKANQAAGKGKLNSLVVF